MKYEFGFLDYTQFMIGGTAMDCVPHFDIELEEKVNVDQLQKAVSLALTRHIIFATKVEKAKRYYLVENHAEFPILSVDEAPHSFGATTNGYLWRVSYSDNHIHFDINHGLTDGQGMAKFVQSVLEAYFNLPLTYETEKYFDAYRETKDPTVEPLGIQTQKKGFSKKELPHIKDGNPTQLTFLKLKTADLVSAAKKLDASPAALITPLLSRAIRNSLPNNAKNRNVNFTITADFRGPMNVNCGRNFVGMIPITYTERFDKLDMETLGTVYRGIIDLSLQPENITWFCTKTMNELSFLTDHLPGKLLHGVLKTAAPLAKSDTNGYLTYIGKLPFSKELTRKIKSYQMILYPDTGYSAMAIADFDGTMQMSFTNNYKTDQIIPNLVREFENINIPIEYSKTIPYAQSRFVF